MRILTSFLLLFSFTAASAEDKQKTAFEKELEHYSDYPTKERWVKIGDTRYREVEYGGKKYYIKFTGREGDYGELDCNGPSSADPSVVESGVAVFHRSKLFVSFIQESCVKDERSQRHAQFKLDPRLGFTIPDSPKSTLTNKKVFVASTGLGFSSDW